MIVSGCPTLPTPPRPRSANVTAEAASIRGPAILWLPSGNDHLVVDWDWCRNHLPFIADQGNRQLVGKCNVGAIWQRGRFKMFSINLGQKAMGDMFDEVGHPQGPGRWLAAALLPRLRSAAVRLVTPCRVQIWIKL